MIRARFSPFPLVIAILTLVQVNHANADFFDTDDPIYLRIEAPIRELKKQRDDDPDWLEGKLFISQQGETEPAFDIKIKARGNFRRQEKICPFPSYRLNFKKQQVKGTVFAGLNKVKVVAHCRETIKPFDPHIYREYLAYKTYNLITEHSFRVRLAYIQYQHPGGKSYGKPRVAFLIEPSSVMEKRLKGKVINDQYVEPSHYDPAALCQAELFQYFIGNTDFTFFASVDNCCHNGKALKLKGSSQGFVPIPYDFDMTGIVDTPYASVNPKLPIKKVTQRIYRGVEVSDDILQATIDNFLDKKAAIYELWENFEPLNIKHRVKALDFIDEFYATLENPENIEAELTSKMRDVEKLDNYITGQRSKNAVE